MSPAKTPDTQDPDTDNDITEVSTEDDLISSDSGYVHHRRRGWFMVIVYMLIALLFAVAVVFLGRWVYHKVHKTEPTPAANTSAQNTGTNPQLATPATPTGNSGSSSQNTSNNSSGTSTTTTNPATNGQVPNTGPGNVVALFAGTAVIVGGLHYVYGLRRTS
jgi:hypothetical protein